jgi:hypothetical protein
MFRHKELCKRDRCYYVPVRILLRVKWENFSWGQIIMHVHAQNFGGGQVIGSLDAPNARYQYCKVKVGPIGQLFGWFCRRGNHPIKEYRNPSCANCKLSNSGKKFGGIPLPHLDLTSLRHRTFDTHYAPNKSVSQKIFSRQLRIL